MAEISVPAWPMPIHQTKLTIANPQPMGMLMPQIPTPLVISQARHANSSITMENAKVNPASQPSPSGRVNTIEEILSVTEAYVCPGSSTGSGSYNGCEFNGISGALIPSPDPYWYSEPPPDTLCDAARSVPPRSKNYADGHSISLPGCSHRWSCQRRWLPTGKRI